MEAILSRAVPSARRGGSAGKSGTRRATMEIPGQLQSKAQARLPCSEKLLNRFPSGFRRKWNLSFRCASWSAMSRKRARFDFGWRENASSDDFGRKLKHAITLHPLKINPESSSKITDLAPCNKLTLLLKAGTAPASGNPERPGSRPPDRVSTARIGRGTKRDTCRGNATPSQLDAQADSGRPRRRRLEITVARLMRASVLQTQRKKTNEFRKTREGSQRAGWGGADGKSQRSR
jgi:hypothetical protein